MSTGVVDEPTITVNGNEQSNENEQQPIDNEYGGSSDSDGAHEKLEVIFERQDTQRRRASVDQHASRRRMGPGKRKTTSCFVHTLLENNANGQHVSLNPQGLSQERPTDKETHSPSSNGESHTQSRLLTKQQLSDMAFGIRELSKKLGHIRLLLKVQNVFLLTKARDQKLIALTRHVTEWLLDQEPETGLPYIVWVEDTMKHNKTFNAAGILEKDPQTRTDRLRYWNNELCRRKPHTFEICLALGGDGTVLYASWLFQRIVPPVMSFALGSLGFLTKFDFDKYPEILTRAFNEGVTVSLRLRFEATIMRSQRRKSRAIEASKDETADEHKIEEKRDDNGDNDNDQPRDLVDELIGEKSDDISTHAPFSSHNILNDIVIDRGPNPTMSSIEVFGDEEHFTTVQADGICVATPTGSTAYNLAAGGSLCHPDNPVVLVTAIAPHTLSFRPIILPDTIVLRIGVPYDARASCWASFDGKERNELCPGDYVTISASRFPFPSVLPLDRRREDWVDSISRTLNWNNRQRQKAFDAASKD